MLVRDPELSIAGWLLLRNAQRLRERAFSRTVEALDHDSIKFVHTSDQIFQIHPVEPAVTGLMAACSANTWSRDRLANVPISRPGRSALSDPELVPMLQDLADILAASPNGQARSILDHGGDGRISRRLREPVAVQRRVPLPLRLATTSRHHAASQRVLARGAPDSL